jgi:flagellum-specific peptidoglycan hydrolase FlgJ
MTLHDPAAPPAQALSHPILAGDPLLQRIAATGDKPLHATGELVPGMGPVQDALNHLGAKYADYRVNLGATGQFRGFFGEKTKQAVRNFQATHNLQADGAVGKDTLRALDAALRSFDANGGVDQTRTAAPMPTSQPGFRTAFIQMVVPFAQACAKKTGVPASVTIAQAALESDWGRSGLTQKAKNFFGMKGTGPAGSVDMPTKEEIKGKMVTVIARFRAYNSFQESCDDHGDRIANARKPDGTLIYAEAMKHTGDARKFAGALEGVYATDSKYAEKLWGMMDTYQLEQYDV